MVLSFRTGQLMEGADNEVIIDPVRIRSIYLKKWFWIDLISTVPIDTFATAIHKMSNGETYDASNLYGLKYIRLTKLFQLLRLLRLTRFFRTKHQWEEIFEIPLDNAMVILRFMCIMVCLLVYAHISACLQFMVLMLL